MKRIFRFIPLIILAAVAGCGPAQLIIAAIGGAAGGGGAAATTSEQLIIETVLLNEVPTVSNLVGPENGSDITPTFRWIGNDLDDYIIAYQIQIDDTPCGEITGMSWTSPMLRPGTHDFQVVAIDLDNAASEPATWHWDLSFNCGTITLPATVPIDAANFTMGDYFGIGNGDEIPLHEVTLSQYEIGSGEITTLRFAEFLNAGFDDCYYPSADQTIVRYGNGSYVPVAGRENDPAVFVTWEAANAYCALLSWITTYTWRLPTEAEWEYAARGGLGWPLYPTGDTIDGNAANYRYSGDVFETGDYPWTSPVGYFDNNGYGLYDMAGNVREWCLDFYAPDYYQNCSDAGPVSDPTGPDSGPMRVLRGGSWNTDPYSLRCAHRFFALPETPDFDIGFRCVRER